ncbi:MAG: J domain-containing protein [Ilumatobacteraceae bacterium]|nr:J domain-containing protein [Ilumatobacter sp.]MCB0985104.1 J domain-containing protein [Ilumatobacter sp.]MCO5331032.1 J domain-containing protein [Ilumatobacteraceae bacterium]
MAGDDPFAVLGVDADADEQALAAARRRKAWQVHPDRGGSHAEMQRVNAAYELALALRLHPPSSEEAGEPAEPAPGPGQRRRARMQRVQPLRRMVRDDASFTIDALPVEAYEALLVVTSWIGEALVDDPPYALEVFLEEPEPCWCRLDLVPDAGGSTVSLTVAGVEGPAPDVDAVRDVWVANLNRLGSA